MPFRVRICLVLRSECGVFGVLLVTSGTVLVLVALLPIRDDHSFPPYHLQVAIQAMVQENKATE